MFLAQPTRGTTRISADASVVYVNWDIRGLSSYLVPGCNVDGAKCNFTTASLKLLTSHENIVIQLNGQEEQAQAESLDLLWMLTAQIKLGATLLANFTPTFPLSTCNSSRPQEMRSCAQTLLVLNCLSIWHRRQANIR